MPLGIRGCTLPHKETCRFAAAAGATPTADFIGHGYNNLPILIDTYAMNGEHPGKNHQISLHFIISSVHIQSISSCLSAKELQIINRYLHTPSSFVPITFASATTTPSTHDSIRQEILPAKSQYPRCNYRHPQTSLILQRVIFVSAFKHRI